MFEGTVFAPRPDVEGARQRLAQEQASIEATRNQARLDAVEQAQRQLEASLAAIETQARAEAGLRTEVNALRREVAGLRAERDQLRKEIVDDLSARIGKLMAAQGGGSSSRVPTVPAGGRQAGRLHKVERSQTLSEIARAYKTTVDAVMKANNMTNPNQLREGQELFIPE
jgi:LysM repeat protein